MLEGVWVSVPYDMVRLEDGAFGARAPILSIGFCLRGAAGEDHTPQTAAHAAAHSSLDGDLVWHVPLRSHFRDASQHGGRTTGIKLNRAGLGLVQNFQQEVRDDSPVTVAAILGTTGHIHA